MDLIGKWNETNDSCVLCYGSLLLTYFRPISINFHGDFDRSCSESIFYFYFEIASVADGFWFCYLGHQPQSMSAYFFLAAFSVLFPLSSHLFIPSLPSPSPILIQSLLFLPLLYPPLPFVLMSLLPFFSLLLSPVLFHYPVHPVLCSFSFFLLPFFICSYSRSNRLSFSLSNSPWTEYRGCGCGGLYSTVISFR